MTGRSETGAVGKDSPRPGRVVLLGALLLFLVWMLVTWALEGRIGTFQRPDNAGDRAIYAVVANLLIGTFGGLLLLCLFVQRNWLGADATGFGRRAASPLAIVAALALGFGFYAVQGAPTWHPVVLLNAYAQVLVVTVAEVVVCWTVVAVSVEAVLRSRGRAIAFAGALLAASIAFGVYHYAHSAPFNTHAMVAFLAVVGFGTGIFFLVSRDVFATVLFHNFLGVFGVVSALVASGGADAIRSVQWPLLAMAVVSIAVLAVGRRFIRR